MTRRDTDGWLSTRRVHFQVTPFSAEGTEWISHGCQPVETVESNTRVPKARQDRVREDTCRPFGTSVGNIRKFHGFAPVAFSWRRFATEVMPQKCGGFLETFFSASAARCLLASMVFWIRSCPTFPAVRRSSPYRVRGRFSRLRLHGEQTSLRHPNPNAERRSPRPCPTSRMRSCAQDRDAARRDCLPHLRPLHPRLPTPDPHLAPNADLHGGTNSKPAGSVIKRTRQS